MCITWCTDVWRTFVVRSVQFECSWYLSLPTKEKSIRTSMSSFGHFWGSFWVKDDLKTDPNSHLEKTPSREAFWIKFWSKTRLRPSKKCWLLICFIVFLNDSKLQKTFFEWPTYMLEFSFCLILLFEPLKKPICNLKKNLPFTLSHGKPFCSRIYCNKQKRRDGCPRNS